ncbi:reverse transcriptase domain-containing protein (plasmid) [Aneurinibacillus sp. Ricciae_BoGa-3]|uniref:HNH endonuclease n=1 Tax=Aneurinibacillus sp. Ricciae_BoGa-3 TaxID=3022697 RepID=UPI00234022C7|nr:reverse transcriptase domain-containing protein [Aneurinibacillus sp. Ricciae_BoGa-3]WCK57282.1 reverse transcriptase domain-containing protein [Aneurinibacillus sp. Ricciae_BoGa-3]
MSPILSNIYLHELDKYMDKYKKMFDKGKAKKENQSYKNAKQKALYHKNKMAKIWDTLTPEQKVEANKNYKKLRKLQLQESYANPMDESYRRIQYVRYADDFLVGVIGSKENAEKVKADLTTFLNEQLNLELSQEKTLITNSRDKAKFLGFEVNVCRDQALRPRKDGVTLRSNNLVVGLTIPTDTWVNKLKELKALRIDKHGNWRASARPYLKNHDELEIISIYNAEIRGLHNYYKLASNINTLSKFRSFMKYSFLMTLASKNKSSVGKEADSHRIDGKLGVKYETAKGSKVRYFHDDSFEVERLGRDDGYGVDIEPNTLKYNGRNSLITRLLANHGEWCGRDNVALEIHHVKKLKNLKGKKAWEKFMISRNRKTMAMCFDCHHDLHNGKLD